MQSYITPDEAVLLQLEPRFEGETIAYRQVSQTQLSIARHYGGATVHGKTFAYMPATDELIRDDVVAYLSKHRKAKQEAALDELAAQAQQLGLDY